MELMGLRSLVVSTLGRLWEFLVSLVGPETCLLDENSHGNIQALRTSDAKATGTCL